MRPAIGGAVLVAGVRTVDALWRRVTGRPTPVEQRLQDGTDAAAGDPAIVRDRMLYAALLSGALRLARRAGLPAERPVARPDGARPDGGGRSAGHGSGGRDEKSPA